MTADKEDKKTIRELAKKYAEIAANPINAERRRRMTDTNDLKPVRPVVLIDEIPWHEMDIDGQLRLSCKDDFAQMMEWFFRSALFRWKYLQTDMVMEGVFRIHKAYTPFLGQKDFFGIRASEETVSSGNRNSINSRAFADKLDSEEKLELISAPDIKILPEMDKLRTEFARDILDGILPVRLTGNCIYCAPWDFISEWRGVEPILSDSYENPKLLHKTIDKLTKAYDSVMTQFENKGLLDYDIADLHCTPPYAGALPAKDYKGGNARLKDIWFRGMAQPFSAVSPAMHDEFDIAYMRPLAERCGLTYYGCCEPLHDRIHILKKIKNLRKISVSPWADAVKSAEHIGTDYVFAKKPNPSLVADSINTDAVRKEIEETILACKRYKCPYEFVLKDISTVSGRPRNLIEWSKIAQETIDKYY